MGEAKANLSEIGKSLINGEEDYVIISKYGKPYLKITLCEKSDSVRIGLLKGRHEYSDEPDWFNNDISKLFDSAEENS